MTNATTAQLLIDDAIETIDFIVGEGFSVNHAMTTWAGRTAAGVVVIDAVRVHYGLAPIGDRRPAPGRIP